MELAGAVHADSGGIAAPEKLAVGHHVADGHGALAGTAGVLKAAAVDGEHRAGVFRVLRHGVAAHIRTEHRADGDLHTHRIVDHGDVAAPALADDARYEQPVLIIENFLIVIPVLRGVLRRYGRGGGGFAGLHGGRGENRERRILRRGSGGLSGRAGLRGRGGIRAVHNAPGNNDRQRQRQNDAKRTGRFSFSVCGHRLLLLHKKLILLYPRNRSRASII